VRHGIRKLGNAFSLSDKVINKTKNRLKLIKHMQINSLSVSLKHQDSASFTFSYTINARLNATDEAAVKWGLYVMIMVFGFENGVFFNRGHNGYAGNPVTPTGKQQGEAWSITFEQVYQKSGLAMSGRETSILTSARLIPVTAINESNQVTHTFVAQI
jgi:hypothetical protein